MNKSQLLAASSILAISSVVGTAAFAQSDNGDVEQVVVSASRISIAGYQAPTPVTTLSAQQLLSAGYADVAQSVEQLPAVGAYTAPNASYAGVGSGTAGGWVINLRNLGNLRTLTLIDGQRTVSQNVIQGGSDLGMIPSDLVQRVDIVTGGASAAWGSDAVAGVVNVILDKNFTGFTANILGTDSQFNNPGYKGSLTWGSDLDGNRGHVELSFSHEDDGAGLWASAYGPGPTYLVNNPAYAPGSGQPQMIHEYLQNAALLTPGGLITANPAGTTPGSANLLRGIQFVGSTATPTPFNFGTIPTITGGASAVVSTGGTPNPTDIQSLDQGMYSYPYTNSSLFGYGSYKVTDNIVASLEANYEDALIESSAGNVTGNYEGFTIASGNPFIPASVQSTMTANGIKSFTLGTTLAGSLPSSAANNISDLQEFQQTYGEDTDANHAQTLRVAAALNGTIGNDWSWNAYYEHSQMHEQQTVLEDPVKTNLANALNAVTAPAGNTAGIAAGSIVCASTLTNPGNGCVPIDPFGTGNFSQAAQTYIDPPDVNHYSLTQDAMEASMQGTLPWQLPAGDVAVVFGAGYRKEAGFSKANAISAAEGYYNGDLGLGMAPHSYNVIEGFGEVDAPLLKNDIVESLDLNAAGRITNYSTSGLVETWKLGLTSQINDDVRLRGTWSLDIRAPDLYELFNSPGGNDTAEPDPKTGHIVTEDNLTGGNPNLHPEVSTTLSGGVVLTPHWVDGLSLSVDWYSIDIKEAITTLTNTFILTQCSANLASPYCGYITFDGPGGAMSAINLTPANAESQTDSGVDFEGDYTTDLFSGSLLLHLVGNYTDEETTTVPAEGSFDFAGSVGGNSQYVGVPKFRATLAATYTQAPWSATIQGRFVGAAMLNTAWDNNGMVDDNNIPNQEYLDVRASYNWTSNIQLYGAMDNVTDVSPPLMAYIANVFTTSYSLGTDYDTQGRVYRLGVRFNF